MQFAPSKTLAKLVKHYLYVESNGKDIKEFRLFPDGNTGIVFSFKNRLISSNSSFYAINYLPFSFIYGQIKNFMNVFCVNETSLLIVVFHPHGLNQLLGIPAYELIDQIIDLDDQFGTASAQLTEQLFNAQPLDDRIKKIESFLISVLHKHTYAIHPLVLASLEMITNSQGFISVKQMVTCTGYSEKSVERRFIESIGIFPKQFTKIIKLNAYLKGLRDNNGGKLLNIAYQNGYYDHSHVSKDFKQITGVTPRQYIYDFNALALNLLEYPKKDHNV